MSTTKNSRSQAAVKANATRRLRDAFYARYAWADVVESLVKTHNSHQTSLETGCSVATVAAVRANLNRPGPMRTAALAAFVR